MANFSLTTVWALEAPREPIWQAIYRAEDWPRWWPFVKRVVKLDEGDENSVGALRRLTWRTRLPYRITFETRATRVERPFYLEAQALGELTGTGCWTLWEIGGATAVRCEWNVRTTKPWMLTLAPVARPLFEWNHNAVMRIGGEGLATSGRAPAPNLTLRNWSVDAEQKLYRRRFNFSSSNWK